MRNQLGIDEAQKPWTRKIGADEYDIVVGRRCPKCRRIYPEIDSPEKPKCRHKAR